MYIYIYIHRIIVFTTEGFLEVAIESWLEWDLNPRPLKSVQTLTRNSHSEPTLLTLNKEMKLE